MHVSQRSMVKFSSDIWNNQLPSIVITGMDDRMCARCNKLYTPCRTSQKFCTSHCSKMHWKEARRLEIVPRACEVCETVYQPHSRTQRVCSKPCRSRLYRDLEAMKDRGLRAAFGITTAQAFSMMEAQGGCGWCGVALVSLPLTPSGRRQWHIDHDHACCPTHRTCGKCIRGILCRSCNHALGHLESSFGIERLLAGEAGSALVHYLTR